MVSFVKERMMNPKLFVFFFLSLFLFLCSASVSTRKDSAVIIDSLLANEIYLSEEHISLEDVIKRIARETSPEAWVSLSTNTAPLFEEFSIYGDFFNTMMPYYVHLTSNATDESAVVGPFTPKNNNEIIITVPKYVEEGYYTTALYRENVTEIPFRGAVYGHSPLLFFEPHGFVCDKATTAGVYTELFSSGAPLRYCLPDMNGGLGWTLLMQTRDTANEAVKTNLNTLMNKNIGSPHALANSDSYTLARADWAATDHFNEFLYLVHTDGTHSAPNSQFSFVFRTQPAAAPPFPDSVGTVVDSDLAVACSLDLTRCHTDAFIRYVGSGFLPSGRCNDDWASNYGGWWGVCTASDTSLFLNEVFGGVRLKDTCKLQLYKHQIPPPTRLYGRYSASPSF